MHGAALRLNVGDAVTLHLKYLGAGLLAQTATYTSTRVNTYLAHFLLTSVNFFYLYL